jgi:hypothetical protein
MYKIIFVFCFCSINSLFSQNNASFFGKELLLNALPFQLDEINKSQYKTNLLELIKKFQKELNEQTKEEQFAKYASSRIENPQAYTSSIIQNLPNSEWKFVDYFRRLFQSRVQQNITVGALYEIWTKSLDSLRFNIDAELAKNNDLNDKKQRCRLGEGLMDCLVNKMHVPNLFLSDAINKMDYLFISREKELMNRFEDWHQNELRNLLLTLRYKYIFKKQLIESFDKHIMKGDGHPAFEKIKVRLQRNITEGLNSKEELIPIGQAVDITKKALLQMFKEFVNIPYAEVSKGDSLKRNTISPLLNQLLDGSLTNKSYLSIDLDLPIGFGSWIASNGIEKHPDKYKAIYAKDVKSWMRYHLDDIQNWMHDLKRQKINPKTYLLNKKQLSEQITSLFPKDKFGKISKIIPAIIFDGTSSTGEISVTDFEQYWRKRIRDQILGLDDNIHKYFDQLGLINNEVLLKEFFTNFMSKMPESFSIIKACENSKTK